MDSRHTPLLKPIKGLAISMSVSVALAATIIALTHQAAVAVAAPSVEASINAPAHPLAPAGQDVWTPLGGPLATGGQVNDIAVKPGVPDTVITLVGMPGDGGNTQIYRSLDGTGTWSAVYAGNFKQLYSIAITGTTAYAVGDGSNDPYDAIKKSSDGGATWSSAFTAEQDNNQYSFMAVAVAPSSGATVVAAGHTNANNLNRSLVVSSTNGGASWSEVLSVPDATSWGKFDAIAINPAMQSTMFVGGAYNNQAVIYRTTNGGQTWTQVFTATDIGGGQTPSQITALLIHPLTPTIVFAGTSYGPNVIYRSADNGASWQLVNEDTNWAGFQLAYKAPNTIYGTSEWGDVHVSTSGGLSGTWQQVGALNDGRAVIAVGASKLYAGTQNSGLAISSNGGADWTLANNGITSFVRPVSVIIDPHNSSKLFVGAGSGGGWLSVNGGHTWSRPANTAGWQPGQSVNAFAVNASNSNIVYAGAGSCHQGSVLRSSNGGLTFTPVYSPANVADCNGSNENIYAVAIAPSLATTVYAAGQYQMQNDQWRGLIARSTNDGASWTVVYSITNNSRIDMLAINPQNANMVLAAGQDCSSGPCVATIVRSTDGGVTWLTRLSVPDGREMSSIAISEQDPTVMIAATQQYQMYKSTDSGATWTMMHCAPWMGACSLPGNQTGSSGSLVAFDPHSSDHIFLAGWGYVAESFDGGITFTDNGRLNAGAPQADPGAFAAGYAGSTLTLYAGFSGVWKFQATKLLQVLQPWTAWGGPIASGGQVNDLAVISGTPDTAFALVGTPGDGGNTKVYRSIDNAAHWTAVYTGSANKLFAVSVAGQTVVAVGQGSNTPGDAIVESTDSGANWSPLFNSSSLNNNQINFDAVALDPNQSSTIVAAGRYNGNWNGGVVVSSTNGGATWTNVLEMHNSNGEFYALAINPSNPATLFAAGRYDNNGVIYRSTNAGLSWTQVFTTSDVGAWMLPQQVNALLIHPLTPNIIFAGTGPGPNVIYRSTDNGDTWLLVSDRSHWAGYRLGFRAPNTIYGIYDGGDVYVSASGGVSGTWSQMGSISDNNPAFAVGATTLYGGGSNGGVHISTNNGTDWVSMNTGVRSLVLPQSIAVDPRNPAKIFVGAGSGGGWLTTNTGQSWTNPNNTAGWWTGYPLNVFAINPANSNIVYAGSSSCHQGSVLRSGDGGLNFTPVFTPANNVECSDNNENISAIAIAPSLTTTVYAGGQYQLPGDQWRGMIARSVNDGATWAIIYSLSNNSRIDMLAINPMDASKVFAVGQDCSSGPCQGVILRSINSGGSWTKRLTDASANEMQSITIEPHNPTVLYAANNNYRVYRSTDSGDTWMPVHCVPWDGSCALPSSQKNSSGWLVVADPVENGHIYLSGWGYIAESRDSGITWVRIDQGIPNMDPRALVVTRVGITQTVYAGMSGVWSYQQELVVTMQYTSYMPMVSRP